MGKPETAKSVRWLVGYGAALAALAMTKENAFFVFLAGLGILVGNRWLKLGCVTRQLVLTSLPGQPLVLPLL